MYVPYSVVSSAISIFSIRGALADVIDRDLYKAKRKYSDTRATSVAIILLLIVVDFDGRHICAVLGAV